MSRHETVARLRQMLDHAREAVAIDCEQRAQACRPGSPGGFALGPLVEGVGELR